MAVYLRKRKVSTGWSYYLDCYHSGNRWYEKLDLRILHNDSISNKRNTLEQAKASRSLREIELAAGGTMKPKHYEDLDFLTFFQMRVDRYPGKNKNRLKSILREFKTFTGQSMVKFSGLNKMMLRDFRKHLGGKYNGCTPADYFQKFRSILNDAVDSGYLIKNPAEGIKNPDPTINSLRKEVLFDNEILQLSKTPCQNLELRRACLFSCMTGLGWAEILKLEWSNIDYNHKSLKVYRSKTDEPQLVPLNDAAVRLLGTPGAKNAKVFHLKISANGANKTIQAWVKRAGIEKHITFYCFRHSFITNILFHTGNLKLASSLAGHTTTRHTEKYAHLVDSSRRDAVEKLPAISFDLQG